MDTVMAILRPDGLGDYLVYASFFLALITSGIIPEKSQNARWVMTVVLFCAVMIKIRIQARLGIEPFFQDFAWMMLALGMGILPYISAGLIRVRGRQGRASMPLAIFTGIVGSLYVLLFFLVPDMIRS